MRQSLQQFRFALRYRPFMILSFCLSASLIFLALFAASGLRAQVARLSPEEKLDAAAEVLQQLDGGAADVEVIVSLVEPPGKPMGKDWDSRPKLRQWQAAINVHRDGVLA